MPHWRPPTRSSASLAAARCRRCRLAVCGLVGFVHVVCFLLIRHFMVAVFAPLRLAPILVGHVLQCEQWLSLSTSCRTTMHTSRQWSVACTYTAVAGTCGARPGLASGESCAFKCESGFWPSNGTGNATCLLGNLTQTPDLVCSPRACYLPPNASVALGNCPQDRMLDSGASCTLVCAAEYAYTSGSGIVGHWRT
jgi:hypothetical protein